MTLADENWWDFSIDKEIRKDPEGNTHSGPHTVNPLLADGRRTLDYSKYLGLESLLHCQAPSSRIPDERVFIITHQLFELVFKEMIFDLAVIGKTFASLLQIEDADEFLRLCSASRNAHYLEDEEFWRPAFTASARVRYSSRDLLPAIMGFFDNSESRDETFNSIEFERFRKNLSPASGFQTAQFRRIQQAFGKINLLKVRVFPGDDYRRNYSKEGSGFARVIDPLILGDIWIPEPDDQSPEVLVYHLDDLAHAVLAKLPQLGEEGPSLIPIRQIQESSVISVVDKVTADLKRRQRSQEKSGRKPSDADDRDRETLAQFREDLDGAVDRENARRQELRRARTGAAYLHYLAPSSYLAEILDRLVSADKALHGEHEQSFLSMHFKVARTRFIELEGHAKQSRQEGDEEGSSVEGTGGGGLEYLVSSRKYLVLLFPALVAYLDLEDTPAFTFTD